MHPSTRNLTLFGLAALLIAALIGFALTRQAESPGMVKPITGKNEPGQAKLVDQSPLETAHNLSNVASTGEEQKLAAEAVRIADHEVDIAFASALQQAQLHPPAQNAETKELNRRIRFLDSRLQAVQEHVSRLTKLAANPGTNDAHAIQQQLGIAQAAIPRPRSSRNWRGTRPCNTVAATLLAGSSSKPISFNVEEHLVSRFRSAKLLLARDGCRRLAFFVGLQLANFLTHFLASFANAVLAGLVSVAKGHEITSLGCYRICGKRVCSVSESLPQQSVRLSVSLVSRYRS